MRFFLYQKKKKSHFQKLTNIRKDSVFETAEIPLHRIIKLGLKNIQVYRKQSSVNKTN